MKSGVLRTNSLLLSLLLFDAPYPLSQKAPGTPLLLFDDDSSKSKDGSIPGVVSSFVNLNYHYYYYYSDSDNKKVKQGIAAQAAHAQWDNFW